jgi:hypothetical protein
LEPLAEPFLSPSHRKDWATLSAINETKMNGNNEETKENDSKQELPKGDSLMGMKKN